MKVISVILAGLLSSISGALAGPVSSAESLDIRATSGNFSYDSKTFYVNGQPYQIIGGQIDPQRVPKEYWAQRIQMAKSMGLNTIFSYLYWHHIEPKQGTFDFTGNNDIVSWYQAIKDAGMMAVLRPGPYVCAERDWGGLPGWLSQIPGMRIRSNNTPFLSASSNYLAQVGKLLQPFLISNGGPILMVQIENEYGYVGNDMNYKSGLSKALLAAFPNTKQYTNDGATTGALQSGYFPGALAIIDGTGPQSGFPVRDQAITDKSSLGPQMDGEYWVTWFDNWGPKNGHACCNNGGSTIDWMLSQGHHFSIYMFHGGTSFAYGNGAGGPNPTTPFTTSYDYGAPLDETGRTSYLYSNFRNVIANHVKNIPAVPSTPPLQTISDFTLTPVVGLFDSLPDGTTSNSPQVMEALGQCFGYILYEYIATGSVRGPIQPGPGAPRDRVIIYVNGVKQGVLNAIYKNIPQVSISLNKGDKLWLFVENLGRVDNGFSDQTKGISGAVTVGGTTLSGPWKHYLFPVNSAPTVAGGTTKSVSANGPPVWYHGTFQNSQTGMAADTFLELPGGIKGVVFVNGHNLGRYWTVGPQQQLYVPGAWLNQGSNEVFVLELEPQTAGRVARGSATRKWGNNPDPDCNNCS